MGLKDFSRVYVGGRQIVAAYSGTARVYGADVEATVPDAFDSVDWFVETGDEGAVALTIVDLPFAGGAIITALQYTIDGGETWVALTGTGLGERILTMPAAGAPYAIALRPLNTVGPGAPSAPKSVTSGAAPATLNVTFGTGAVTVTSLPNVTPLTSVTFGTGTIIIAA